mgnify:CR=1 FL=1
MSWVVIAIAARLAYWLWGNLPKYRYGEIITVPGNKYAGAEQAEAHARALGLARDEHKVVTLHGGSRSQRAVIRITRGYL